MIGAQSEKRDRLGLRKRAVPPENWVRGSSAAASWGGVRSVSVDQREIYDAEWSGGVVEAVWQSAREWSYRVQVPKDAWFVLINEDIEAEERFVDGSSVVHGGAAKKSFSYSYVPAGTELKGYGRNLRTQYLAVFTDPDDRETAFGGSDRARAPFIATADAATIDLSVMIANELRRPSGSGRVSSLLTDALLHKLQSFQSADRSRSGAGLSRQRLDAVRMIVEAQFQDDISVADLAREVGLSRHHFQRAFKASAGVTVARYVYERRIAKAKLMLAEGSSVTEAAHRCGFASSQHFAVVFRRQTGLTPSAYRIASLRAGTSDPLC